MTIEQAIQNCKDKAKELRANARLFSSSPMYDKTDISYTLGCADEQEQLAHWLEELVKLRSQLTDGILEAYLKIMDSEFEHSDGFWITTPKGKKIYFEKKRQGEWIDTGDMQEYWSEEFQCSICGAKDHWHNFCPNCGAKMKEVGGVEE